MTVKRPLGEIMVEQGTVSEAEIEEALAEQQETGERLGEILVEKGRMTRLDLAGALAEQWASMPKLRPPSKEGEQCTHVMPAPEAGPVADHGLQAAVAADLVARTEELAAAPAAAGELDEQVASLSARIGVLHTSVEDLGGKLADLAARLGSLPALLDEWCDDVAALAARLDALPVPSDEWRIELEQVAENLLTRLERLEGLDLREQLAESFDTLQSQLSERGDPRSVGGAGRRAKRGPRTPVTRTGDERSVASDHRAFTAVHLNPRSAG